VVSTEVEALQLEYSWIKEYDPRFNVRYRDDKSYPYLAVTLDEEYPRLQVMRGDKRKGTRYFGPYSHAWAIRETLDLLLRVFPARTCSKGVFVRARQIGRPCLLGDIGKCSAPCVGRVDAAEHRAIVEEFCDFMAGRTDTMVRRLEREMREAAQAQEYERAARVRDDLVALRRAMEKQTVVLGDGTDADVVAFAEDQLEAAVQVFHVRGGRVRGQRGWVVEKTEELSTGDLVHHFCSQVYGAAGAEPGPHEVPRELLVPALPPDADALADWLSGRRGTRVQIRVPQRGDKRALLETVARNAAQALTQHKLRRAGDLTARSQALEEIAEALAMPGAPQVNAAAAVLAEVGVADVTVCGLAKRLEEIWLPGEDFPVVLPRRSEGLYLMQRIRDEAHRFAITFHRKRRSRRMTVSALDEVPGLGETRRKALLAHFGSLRRLAAASAEEITEVPGIGRRTAEAVLAALGGDAAGPGGEPDAAPPGGPTGGSSGIAP
jgi:excinuclease UvrABC nuclease subunit